MNRGYIKLWRKILDNPVLHERGKRFSKFEAWVDLCLSARGTDDEKSGLKRGQFEGAVRFLAGRWNWTAGSVFNFMSELQQSSMITKVERSIERCRERYPERFNICKYNLYNDTLNAKVNAKVNAQLNKSNKVSNKVSNQGEKDTAAPCQELPAADERLKPMKAFIEQEYLRIRGVKLLSDAGDWSNFNKMLKSTNGAFSLDDLERAWTVFLESPDPFHRNQGHPLRWWSCNLNAFVGNRVPVKKHGLFDLHERNTEVLQRFVARGNDEKERTD